MTNGLLQDITVEESTSIQWVKHAKSEYTGTFQLLTSLYEEKNSEKSYVILLLSTQCHKSEIKNLMQG